MRGVNLNTFDLNLIRVFIALWEQRSVTAAAAQLSLTQPSVSHAIRRLREQFDDPLFTRVGKLMEPTETARQLYQPFNACYDMLREAMANHGEFDPASSTRVFNLAMSDISESFVLPRILTRVLKMAPSICLHSAQLEVGDIAVKLRSGQVDLALGYIPNMDSAEFDSAALLHDGFMCIIREGHPHGTRKLTMRDLEELDFIEVALNATGYQTVRALLLQHGVRRRTRLRVEHFSVLPELVRATDLAAIYPSSVARSLVASGPFIALDLPFAVPSIDVRMHYHSNFRNDPGVSWLSENIKAVFAKPD